MVYGDGFGWWPLGLVESLGLVGNHLFWLRSLVLVELLVLIESY